MKSIVHFSPRVLIAIKLFSLIFVFSFLARIFFAFFFYPSDENIKFEDIAHALYLGAKFDLRIVLIFLIPFLILSTLPRLNPHQSILAKNFWRYVYVGVVTFLLVTFAIDLGYYDYLKDRLNASALQFLSNLSISLTMVWQSYPMGWMFFILVASIYLINLTLKNWVFTTTHVQPSVLSKWQQSRQTLILSTVVLLGLYGKLGFYPLRWSEAFFSGNRFVSALSLNPVHYFFDTLTNREASYDLERIKTFYPKVSAYLGVDNTETTLNFSRRQVPTPVINFQQAPNVVVILMESMAAHRAGVFGNPLEAMPQLDNLARSGWLFTKFFTPTEGTARGVFATVTGTVDINQNRTSSRNPLIVDQNTPANFFTNYDKFYFIGGSANWGNIRGVLTNNIIDLNLYEEGMFEAPRTDVWGISDYDLFKEAHRILSTKNSARPFLAFIQTAGFHRPYTIPEDHGDFQLETRSDGELKKWGFESLAEYNSMRFADYSLGHFIKLAKSSNYFDNTIFVILGDHGLPDNGSQNLTPTMIKHAIERFHTPLVFYGPKFFSPRVIDIVASQQDILPTLAALTGHEIVSLAMGRNIFDKKFDNYRYAFSYVYYRQPHTIFLFDKDYFVTGTPDQIEGLYNYTQPGPPKNIKAEMPEKFNHMKDLLLGLYETSKYVLYHNKKTALPAKAP